MGSVREAVINFYQTTELVIQAEKLQLTFEIIRYNFFHAISSRQHIIIYNSSSGFVMGV